MSERTGEPGADDRGDMEVPLPDMMFADGEEPVGVRVLTYQSSRAINTILDTLEEDEIRFLRASSLVKIIDIAEKPAFSGRFARYMLSRQLKVVKKHEAWFRFAGKPIRFSLREFAIVTGLPCGELPRKPNGKKKKNSVEKLYWPELFGGVEEMRVSKAVKMLRKKTVTDRDIRIKLACLAIVSSVLLSTNLKMKMLKEHAELLSDIDEFFAFPWGRLAFDMLMTSIKKRDEISLSQNTIALKGFALALQLVIVDAVPALMEVVQDACSSSESDSDDEESEMTSSKTRKQTLSPAHARDVDRRAEATVMSIIPQDPERPVDEAICVWNDELEDEKVANLVKLILENFPFTKSMFKGGARKADVDRLREQPRAVSKQKQNQPKQHCEQILDESRVASIVHDILKPQLQRIDGDVAAAVAAVREISSTALAYQGSVYGMVESMLKAFKEEILLSRGNENTQPPAQAEHSTNNFADGSKPPSAVEGCEAEVDANANVIANVLENISHYSTPPGSGERVPGSEGRFADVEAPLGSQHHVEAHNTEAASFSSNININARSQTVDAGHTPVIPLSQEPSFCLGLTQDDNLEAAARKDEVGDNAGDPCAVDSDETQLCRKSKRIRTVPPGLISDYQCGSTIRNRAREGQLSGKSLYDSVVIREKYTKLSTLLKKECVINVAGLSVTCKDITDIVSRKRPLPAKIVDILVRLVWSIFTNEAMDTSLEPTAFLDSRFVSILSRHYPKFKKLRNKSGFSFPKSLVDTIAKCGSPDAPPTRYYMPFQIEKQHWIGICVDLSYPKVVVLDCNISFCPAKALNKNLLPISEMFQHLLKHTGRIEAVVGKSLPVERLQCVPQNGTLADSAITAALLIKTHSMLGQDSCADITPLSLQEEAQRAAVLIYEFHQTI